MDNRQAALIFIWMTAILAWISACAPLNEPQPTPAPTARFTPTRPAPTRVPSTSVPHQCTEKNGTVSQIPFDSVALPQFQIYLPPCYDFEQQSRYPVLYLLHGASFTDLQWIRLGASHAADALIAAEEIPPLIIVMPYDKYSTNLVDEDDFGEVLIEELLPYIDARYRTRSEQRAIGGLSRGAGWAIRYGLTQPELFVAIGGHSPAIFHQDQANLDDWLSAIPANKLPALYLDAGDRDQEREVGLKFVEILSQAGIPHEWRLYTGLHNEDYWHAHIKEYMRWYGNALR
jgi:enterochelin esterase-like enzyme